MELTARTARLRAQVARMMRDDARQLSGRKRAHMLRDADWLDGYDPIEVAVRFVGRKDAVEVTLTFEREERND